jgi:hypothetical protein
MKVASIKLRKSLATKRPILKYFSVEEAQETLFPETLKFNPNK